MKTRNTLSTKLAAALAATLLLGAAAPLFADHDDDRDDRRFSGGREREGYGERERGGYGEREFDGRRGGFSRYDRDEARRDAEERRDDAYRYNSRVRYGFSFGFDDRNRACRD